MSIPRIIHQTWRDEALPEWARELTNTWRRHHPDWSYRLWTDADDHELVRRRCPDLLATYEGYEHPIQRADAVRYLYLHEFGGLYVDLDFECFRPVNELLVGHDCVVGMEPREHARIHGRERLVGNAWLAAAPRHPLLACILGDLLTHRTQQQQVNDRILDTTGPFMVTRVVEAHLAAGREPSVVCLPSHLLYPLSLGELDRETSGAWSAEAERALAGAYAVHHFRGTWWKGASV